MIKNYSNLIQCIIFILTAAVLSYFSEKYNLERRIVIMNFIIILSGFTLPLNYAIGCGVITPIVCCVWFNVPALYPQLLLTTVMMIAFTSFANIFYISAKWTIYPSLFATLIMGGLVLFSAASILSWVSDGFSAVSYVAETLIETFPGIILQIFAIPLTLKIYEHVKNKLTLKLAE